MKFFALLLCMWFVAAQKIVRSEGGQTLEGFTTVVGDGIYAPANKDVTVRDIAIQHSSDKTELRANVLEREIMAHNITYLPVSDTSVLEYIHQVSYEFRLPNLPSKITAGQTLEGGFFIWDGATTKLDYGAAFQWRVNPFGSDYGKVYTWRATPAGKRNWQEVAYLEPDTKWHKLSITLNLKTQTAILTIDDAIQDDAAFAQEQKPGFDNDVTARLQMEIISIDPRSSPIHPTHIGEFRNWSWQWLEP